MIVRLEKKLEISFASVMKQLRVLDSSSQWLFVPNATGLPLFNSDC